MPPAKNLQSHPLLLLLLVLLLLLQDSLQQHCLLIS
jgi:hypothetical protein